MPEILKNFPNAHLVSIGSQSDKLWLAEIKNEIGVLKLEKNVHLLGERRDVKDFLQVCDLFVFPSVFEGLGIALAEALAVGCVCVASDIKPLDEFVEAGKNGVLFEARNVDALRESVLKLLRKQENRRKISQAAHKTALKLFQPAPAAEKLTEIYFSILTREN
jgi:glycosyltransferase EpsD